MAPNLVLVRLASAVLCSELSLRLKFKEEEATLANLSVSLASSFALSAVFGVCASGRYDVTFFFPFSFTLYQFELLLLHRLYFIEFQKVYTKNENSCKRIRYSKSHQR